MKLCGRKPVFTKEMKEVVESLLEEGFSPEQIKGRSEIEGFAMVSHETIYRWIWERTNRKKEGYTNTFAEKERNHPISNEDHRSVATNKRLDTYNYGRQ